MEMYLFLKFWWLINRYFLLLYAVLYFRNTHNRTLVPKIYISRVIVIISEGWDGNRGRGNNDFICYFNTFKMYYEVCLLFNFKKVENYSFSLDCGDLLKLL